MKVGLSLVRNTALHLCRFLGDNTWRQFRSDRFRTSQKFSRDTNGVLSYKEIRRMVGERTRAVTFSTDREERECAHRTAIELSRSHAASRSRRIKQDWIKVVIRCDRNDFMFRRDTGSPTTA